MKTSEVRMLEICLMIIGGEEGEPIDKLKENLLVETGIEKHIDLIVTTFITIYYDTIPLWLIEKNIEQTIDLFEKIGSGKMTRQEVEDFMSLVLEKFFVVARQKIHNHLKDFPEVKG